MIYRRLGASGLQLSALSLGTWLTFGEQVDRRAARELVATALDHGINFFDGAENYAYGEAERLLGDVLADLRPPRDAWCVSSKARFGAVPDPAPTQQGLSRKHLTEACDQALRRLRVDYLDLFFCHRPDPATPLEETVSAMDTLIRQGKVLYWGTSEWPADAIREAHRIAWLHHLQPPRTEQPQYNLLNRRRFETEYAPLHRELGLGTTIWSPLASGLLTGKYASGAIPADSRADAPANAWLAERAADPQRRAQIAALAAIADQLDVSLAQLAIAWCLSHPAVSTVILGARRREQLEQNLGAIALLPRLDRDVLGRIRHAVHVPLLTRLRRRLTR